MTMQPVLIDGEWRESRGAESFQAVNPATKETLAARFPVSPWSEVEAVLVAAANARKQVRDLPGERFAEFLERYAASIEARAEELVACAHQETGLPVAPRLREVELPRTLNQLRLAAAAAREGTWALPTIDSKLNIRSQLGSLGPVVVFGPNNFPFAYNGASGGDFAAAVATGNPVIAKAHPSHPGTTQLFVEAAHQAAAETGMPSGFVQLIYHLDHADGKKLVSHPLLGGTGYTGSRYAGLILKSAADAAGKPIYLELSSVNPVFLLPGALAERFDEIVEEFLTSSLMATGQFCTNPGIVMLRSGDDAERFIATVAARFQAAPPGTLLNEGVERNLRAGIVALQQAGAERVTGGEANETGRFCNPNTLLRARGKDFLENPAGLQEEAFGNSSLIVTIDNDDEWERIAAVVEGSLTGSLYSSTTGAEDALYDRIAAELRPRVGRLLNDKMPTGVAVSPAMQHGGPFPSTGHPGFTAVGVPASLRRFAMLQCYDNVREPRLPPPLRNKNPTGRMWRFIDGDWTQGDVS